MCLVVGRPEKNYRVIAQWKSICLNIFSITVGRNLADGIFAKMLSGLSSNIPLAMVTSNPRQLGEIQPRHIQL
jgi:hypothetical protein